ncbi:MAG: hypothetical protein K2W82_15805 [Candidatus Obscuribacterales bacterium]|jgi:hypothetical protein|nr:hypothetical protein [Candidatus Obscuribacterales bacterium]
MSELLNLKLWKSVGLAALVLIASLLFIFVASFLAAGIAGATTQMLVGPQAAALVIKAATQFTLLVSSLLCLAFWLWLGCRGPEQAAQRL